MSDPYFQSLFAERIGGADYGKDEGKIYKFEKIKRAKRAAQEQQPDRALIDFGIGENDEVAPEPIRAAMAEEIHKPENRGYADNGIAEFKEAVARFMHRTYGVQLDAASEVNHAIGSKPAPGDAARRLHQPGRRDADDHARLPGGRDSHPLLRRSGVQLAADGGQRFFPRSRRHSRRRTRQGQIAGAVLPQQPHRQGGRPPTFTAKWSTSPNGTTSSWCRMRPIWRFHTTRRRSVSSAPPAPRRSASRCIR